MTKQNIGRISGIPESMFFSQSILDVFVLQGILELQDADRLKKHFRTNREIEKFLIKNRLVTKDTINKAYSIVLKLPYIELKNFEIPQEVLKAVPEKICQKLGIIPFGGSQGVLQIAVTNPADLPYGFKDVLSRLFKNKDLYLEIFITGLDDFKKAVTQYKNRDSNELLLKKGSLPVIYLRNRIIAKSNLMKLDKEFIEKYRMIVFEKNLIGNYLVACEAPDSFLTKKILQYIERENGVKLEVFATSKDDIDYALENYEKSHPFVIEKKETPKDTSGAKENINLGNVRATGKKITGKLLDAIFKQEKPSLTVDSVEKDTPVKPVPDKKEELRNKVEQGIINNEVKAERTRPEPKQIILPARISPEYLSKLPKDFISKYRVLVFGENADGALELATDSPDSEGSIKAIEFIKNQFPVEVFKVSKEEIEAAISYYPT